MTLQEAYDAHLAADHAWMMEIRRAFPKEWPGDVRYTPRAHGLPGSPLAAAYLRYVETRTAWETFLTDRERTAA